MKFSQSRESRERHPDSVLRGVRGPIESSSLTNHLSAAVDANFERPAVRDISGNRLTYGELWKESSNLVAQVRQWRIGHGMIMAVSGSRTPALPIGAIAAIRAGLVIAMLRLDEPERRLRAAIAQLGCQYIIAPEHEGAAWKDFGLCVIPWPPAPGTPDNGLAECCPEPFAYIIRTSGTSGESKTVVCTQDGLLNLVVFLAREKVIQPNDIVAQFASAEFDGIMMEVFGALGTGATLALLPDGAHREPELLAKSLNATGATFIDCPPRVLAHLDPSDPRLARLSTVMSGGESVPASLAQRWTASGRRFIDGYGPAEATVITTMSDIPGRSIGVPIDNVDVLVIDPATNEIASLGVEGELYVAGPALGAGYLASRVPGTVRLHSGASFVDGGRWGFDRLYATGDRVRAVKDAVGVYVEFLGRLDQQLNVGGLRFDEEEILAALCAHPDVADAAVVLTNEGPRDVPIISAFVVVRGGKQVTRAEIDEFVQPMLPRAVIPRRLIVVDQLPLTSSGKLDRSTLMTLATNQPPAAGPLGSDWVNLSTVIAGVLDEEPASTGSFVSAGGDSLTGYRVVRELAERFGLELRISDLLSSDTLGEIALSALRPIAASFRAEGGAPPPRVLPLTPTQYGIWIDSELDHGSPVYSQPSAYRIRGKIDVEALTRALSQCFERHECLNLVITADDAGRLAAIPQRKQHDVNCVDIASAPEDLWAWLVEMSHASFDLETGPLVRASIARLAQDDHVLVINVHHIVCDEFSLAIIESELGILYGHYRQGSLTDPSHVPLLAPAPSWSDYAHHLDVSRLRDGRAGWISYIGSATGPSFTPSHPLSPEGAVATQRIQQTRWKEFAERLRSRSATPFAGLMTAYALAIAETTRNNDFIIGAPVAGRSEGNDSLVGPVVRLVPFRVRVQTDAPFYRNLRDVNDAIGSALDLCEHTVDSLGVLDGSAPAISTMLAFANVGAERLSVSGALVERLYPFKYSPQTDVVATADLVEGDLMLTWEYRLNVKPATISLLTARLAAHIDSACRS